jgi:hypothetical protein
MRQFSFDPVNEGEVATYTLSFIPTNNIPNGMNIYIRFPDTFDLRLGKQVDIKVVAGLTGDIKYSLSNRVVTISNFDTYSTTSTTPVQIVVNGVINPNKPATGNSGYISVGTIYPNSNSFVDYLEKAGSVLTTSAPGWYYPITQAHAERIILLEPVLAHRGELHVQHLGHAEDPQVGIQRQDICGLPPQLRNHHLQLQVSQLDCKYRKFGQMFAERQAHDCQWAS